MLIKHKRGCKKRKEIEEQEDRAAKLVLDFFFFRDIVKDFAQAMAIQLGEYKCFFKGFGESYRLPCPCLNSMLSFRV